MMADKDAKESQDLLQSSTSKFSSESGETGRGKKKVVTAQLVFATLAAVLGSSFQFGYNTGVINNAQFVLKDFINQSYLKMHHSQAASETVNLNYAALVSVFAIGGMVGSFTVGHFADAYGRKRTMLLNNVLVGVAVAMVIAARYSMVYYLLFASRLVFGFNCGFNTGLAPLYITEIAPVQLRGAFGTLNQMGIVSAILLSQVLGLPAVLGNESGWMVLLGAPLLFSTLQLITLPFCPETPAFLMSKGRGDEARDALRWLRGGDDKTVDADMDRVRASAQSARNAELLSIGALFRTVALRRALLVAVVMQLSQQLSGINAVFYYSADMFHAAGVSKSQSNLITIGIGVVNVVMCGISVPLMERVGRRSLHLVGLGGMTACAVVLTVTLEMSETNKMAAVAAVVAVMLFVIFFQSGPGSIPWFITAEIFDQTARPSAVSIAGLVNWTGNFIVGIAYPPLQDMIGGYAFAIFSVLLAMFWLFTFFRVPETKGKAIDEICILFQNGGSSTGETSSSGSSKV